MALLLSVSFGLGQPAAAAPVIQEVAEIEVGLIPTQSGGRIKPLRTFAQDTVLFITGSKSFQGASALRLIFSWLADPQGWESVEMIQVNREDVRRQLQLDEKRMRFSPRELFSNFALLQYAEKMGSGSQVAAPLDGKQVGSGQMASRPSPREQELRRVFERMSLYRAMISGEAWNLIPQPDAWKTLAVLNDPKTAQEKPEWMGLKPLFVQLIESYGRGNSAEFDRAAAEVRTWISSRIPDWSRGLENRVLAESWYERIHFFRFAWIFYLTAFLFLSFSLAWWTAQVSGLKQGVAASVKAVSTPIPRLSLRFKNFGILLIALGFAAHLIGYVLRIYISGRPPVTNMYESVLWVASGVIFFSSILYYLQRQPIVLASAAALSAVCLILAESSPAVMDPGIHPLVPVLRSNFWLTIHVLTITLGYAAFALTLGISNVTLFQYLRGKSGLALRVTALNHLNYRAMQFGVVLLAAGTILGGVWADYSWGRFWGWDPKEVWALIALLCYVAILHGRYTGWMGQLGYAAWSVGAFLSVIMAWYGVNFILGAGLHSYGFSTGGRGAVALFTIVQLAYIGLVLAVQRHRAKGGEGVFVSSS